jgi:hypothetical protein
MGTLYTGKPGHTDALTLLRAQQRSVLARYTDRMIRFTLRDLLLAVALVAVGAAGLRLAFSIDGHDIGPLDGAIMLLGWFGAGMSIAAAITGLWRRDWLLGATFGLLVQFLIVLAIIQ